MFDLNTIAYYNTSASLLFINKLSSMFHTIIPINIEVDTITKKSLYKKLLSIKKLKLLLLLKKHYLITNMNKIIKQIQNTSYMITHTL